MPTNNKGNGKSGASTGPKTAHGKKNSSKNAFKHGFFSAELARDEQEKAQIALFRTRVFSELQPHGILLEMAVEKIVVWAWKLKQACRLDQQGLNELQRAQPAAASEASGGEQVPPDAAVLRGLNGLTPTALRHQLKLSEFMLHFEGSTFPAELVEEVRVSFGPAFVELVTEWTPVDSTYMLIKCIQKKEELYPQLKKEELKTPGQLEFDAACNMAQEEAHREGQKALLLLMRQLLLVALEDAQRPVLAVVANGQAKADLAQRISVTANRELRRAIEFYYLLLEKGGEQ